jgi:hypothetical protein
MLCHSVLSKCCSVENFLLFIISLLYHNNEFKILPNYNQILKRKKICGQINSSSISCYTCNNVEELKKLLSISTLNITRTNATGNIWGIIKNKDDCICASVPKETFICQAVSYFASRNCIALQGGCRWK